MSSCTISYRGIQCHIVQYHTGGYNVMLYNVTVIHTVASTVQGSPQNNHTYAYFRLQRRRIIVLWSSRKCNTGSPVVSTILGRNSSAAKTRLGFMTAYNDIVIVMTAMRKQTSCMHAAVGARVRLHIDNYHSHCTPRLWKLDDAVD